MRFQVLAGGRIAENSELNSLKDAKYPFITFRTFSSSHVSCPQRFRSMVGLGDKSLSYTTNSCGQMPTEREGKARDGEDFDT